MDSAQDKALGLGRRQGFVTLAEINDCLPRGVVDVDAMEDMLAVLERNGIDVVTEQPRADDVIARSEAEALAPEGAKRGAGGDALEGEPEANTDVVAHYFRDMGEITRLEPGDEQNLGRSLEQSSRQTAQALALCPAAVESLYARSQEQLSRAVIASGEDELRDAKSRLQHVASMVKQLRVLETGSAVVTDDERGRLRHALVSEIGELRLAPLMREELVNLVRGFIEQIREAENIFVHTCVERARMQRRRLRELMVGNETSPDLVDTLLNEGEANSELISALRDDLVAAQRLIERTEFEAGLGVASLKSLGRSLSQADAASRRAREAMVNANLRLVVSIAKSFNNRGVAFADLVQEGNIGLMQAVEHFDHSKSRSFASQASWWIRRAISQSMGEQGHAIQVPASMAKHIHKLNRLGRQMSHQLGRDPTADELAGPMKLPVEQIKSLMRHAREPVSLQTPVGDEEGSYSIGDLLADREAEGADRAADQADLKIATRELLDSLNPREAAALKLHFGLGTDNNLSYEQLGEHLDMPRERIRQIGVRALKKLRSNEQQAKLKALLDAIDD